MIQKPHEWAVTELQALVRQAERIYRLPRNMLDAIIRVESSYNIKAVNPRRPGVAIPSFGLGQLTRETAMFQCHLTTAEIHDPQKNIMCSAKVLRKQLSRYRRKANAIAWAVAAYNWGTPCVCDGANYVKVISHQEKVCRAPGSLEPLTCQASDRGKFWNQDYVDKFASNFGKL